MKCKKTGNEILYRLESEKNSIGPFQEYSTSEVAKYKNLDFEDYVENHPNSYGDPKLRRFTEDYEFFACNSKSQLKHWFTKKCMIDLIYSEYIIVKIEISPEFVDKGKFQVVYNSEKIIKKEKIDISEIYN